MDEATKKACDETVLETLRGKGSLAYSQAFQHPELHDGYIDVALAKARLSLAELLGELLSSGRAYSVQVKPVVWMTANLTGTREEMQTAFKRKTAYLAYTGLYETLRFRLEMRAVLSDPMEAEIGECADMSGFGRLGGEWLLRLPERDLDRPNLTRDFDRRTGLRIA